MEIQDMVYYKRSGLIYILYNINDDYDWYAACYSRSGLVEEDAVQVFLYYGFDLASSFLM